MVSNTSTTLVSLRPHGSQSPVCTEMARVLHGFVQGHYILLQCAQDIVEHAEGPHQLTLSKTLTCHPQAHLE